MPQVAAPCVDLSGNACADNPAAGQPASLAPSEKVAKAKRTSAVARRAALQRKHARAAKRRLPPQVAAARPPEKPPAAPAPRSFSDKSPSDKSSPEPVPPADGASAPVVKIPSPAKDTPPAPGKVQSEVMVAAVTVAAELAERMTALRVPEGPADSHLVAVVLARPTVRGLADLSGKVIAIDERYAKSNARITTAMNAAGASEVLLLEGQATAITRLSNGEVNAAVVALASPEAAEAFPKIAGFRLFTVALKP
ncbi:hypothetical protein [Bradyrhizobium aeschynomenes]|uniref:hypothetical protein n=1 Tax=Bradyrhizobium aeschynomenes TaxID=2734909 RepID=UPI001FF058C6|nr:hypothetical protein [Bradyrhizobium aeschynomenes]